LSFGINITLAQSNPLLIQINAPPQSRLTDVLSANSTATKPDSE
jgi:hypothetical protein